MKLKWWRRTCLMLGHLFRWQSHSLLRGIRDSLRKLRFVGDYCIALQRTPKKIACSFPRMHTVVACRVFFSSHKTGTFLGLLGNYERTHIFVPLCYHPLCKWRVDPSPSFSCHPLPQNCNKPEKKKSRVVAEGISVPIASIRSILEARTELMRLCLSLSQHLVVSRSYSKVSGSTATQPEGRYSSCPPFLFPCKKDQGKKTHRSQIKRNNINTRAKNPPKHRKQKTCELSKCKWESRLLSQGIKHR